MKSNTTYDIKLKSLASSDRLIADEGQNEAAEY
jgi:hypothetical protein